MTHTQVQQQIAELIEAAQISLDNKDYLAAADYLLCATCLALRKGAKE